VKAHIKLFGVVTEKDITATFGGSEFKYNLLCQLLR